jgi:hypothetical protein
MDLPKIAKQSFDIHIDKEVLVLTEPTYEQMQQIFNLKVTDGKQDALDKFANIVASLMDSYSETIEQKKEFIIKMSVRQLIQIIDGLTEAIEVKKVQEESVTLDTSLPKKQAGN